jgi:hypothetical protein
MFDRGLTIPPSRPATRQAAARRTGQAGPPRQRLVLDRAEHGGILPSGRKPTTQTNHPITLLRCPSYWWRYMPVPLTLLDTLDVVHDIREARKRGREHSDRFPIVEAANERPTGSSTFVVKRARRDPFAARPRLAGKAEVPNWAKMGGTLLTPTSAEHPVGFPWLLPATKGTPPRRGDLSSLPTGQPLSGRCEPGGEGLF